MRDKDIPRCKRCMTRLYPLHESVAFLLPRPDGSVVWNRMHPECATKFFALLQTEEYSEAWERKRKAALRKEGLYVA